MDPIVYLWRYFLQDDTAKFEELLAINYLSKGSNATATRTGTSLTDAHPKSSEYNSKAASPGSSGLKAKYRQASGSSLPDYNVLKSKPNRVNNINTRDRLGRTLLHLVASSHRRSAITFAELLLDIPYVDIYTQDWESGWTPLHRALYEGNVSIAHALMEREALDSVGVRARGAAHRKLGEMLKIKDHEGNSPFDLYGQTVFPRELYRPKSADNNNNINSNEGDSDSVDDYVSADMDARTSGHKNNLVNFQANIYGDEVFSFGSNRNFGLGLGDHDDRQSPELVSFSRPAGLILRLDYERRIRLASEKGEDTSEVRQADSVSSVPIITSTQSFTIRDVVMSKLSTGILTNDPESNLYMCGFGPGGRLGTGDDKTRFSFVCVNSGGLSGKRVVALALGQDHSIAVSEQGEVFTWGSNKYGQLGYPLPETTSSDAPFQLIPRKIFNPLKKEIIIGAAASSIHSVVFSSTSLYAFGKNEGQLGFMDSDARSHESQILPRKIGSSLFSAPITMASAIDRATVCLLENHDVWVFIHYGYSKIIFPLDIPASISTNGSWVPFRHRNHHNKIVKVTAGMNTICALSSNGEVYSIELPNQSDISPPDSSTTNPAKIRNALPQPARAWVSRREFMAARDVAVGQDGSVILCTSSGSMWKREKRAKKSADKRHSKDRVFKFVRIPGLARVVAVRSNAFGAYSAIQRNSDVAETQIPVDESTLWRDIFQLFPLREFVDVNNRHEASLKTPVHDSQSIPDENSLIFEPLYEVHDRVENQLRNLDHLNDTPGFVWLSTTLSDARIPVHEYLLFARVPYLQNLVKECRRGHQVSVPDFITIFFHKNRSTFLHFADIDLLALFNLAVYIYSDSVYDLWNKDRQLMDNVQRRRKVRTDLIKMASYFEIRNLERSARVQVPPEPYLSMDMHHAFDDMLIFDTADTIIELADGNMKAHSQILCHRSPFFNVMFNGRSHGRWLLGRLSAKSNFIRINLKHIRVEVFDLVLRHIYADSNDDLFEDVRADDLEQLLNLVLDVLLTANELILDRLATVCQKFLGQYVDARNVCDLVNVVASCLVTNFKRAALEYICMNLESMLENKLLNDLDPDLILELEQTCRDNQVAYMPSRANVHDIRFDDSSHNVSHVSDSEAQRLLDDITSQCRVRENDQFEGAKSLAKSLDTVEDIPPTPSRRETPYPVAETNSSRDETLKLASKASSGDMMFEMEDDLPEQVPSTTSAPNVLDTSPTAPSFPSQPWSASTGHIAPKSDLKYIMAEASQSRVNTPARPANNVVAPSSRPSQKERKRIMQQQQQQLRETTDEPEETPSSPSPWKAVPKAIPAAFPQASSPSPSSPGHLKFKPAMTLRQTVAGTPQKKSPRIPSSGDPSKPPVSPVSPSLGIPTKSSSKLNSRLFDSQSVVASKENVAPRNSSRDAPLPTHTVARTTTSTAAASSSHSGKGHVCSPQSPGRSSLAYILQEQQSEKNAIREAANAKHNLHDIRVEQEFQEWWDKESSRVMQQAEAAAAPQKTKPSSGGRGRRRAAKGKEKAGPEESPLTNTSSSQTGMQESSGTGASRHRDRRGRQQKRPNVRGGLGSGAAGRGDGDNAKGETA